MSFSKCIKYIRNNFAFFIKMTNLTKNATVITKYALKIQQNCKYLCAIFVKIKNLLLFFIKINV